MRKYLTVYLLIFYLSYSQDPIYYPGFPKVIQGERPFYCGIPLITDLDKDGFKEIVFVITSMSNGNNKLYVIKSDGNILANFPISFSSVITAFASGDVDNNGTNDIVIRTMFAQQNIVVIDKNGNNLPGFPIQYIDNDNQTQTARYISLYDLDRDGKLEIIANRLNEICIFEYNGSVRSGWPRRVVGISYSHPAIGDMDGDGLAEIVVSTYKQIPTGGADSTALHIFKHNGSYYSYSWPIYIDSSYVIYDSSPTLYIDKENRDSSFILISQASPSPPPRRIRNISYNLDGEVIKKTYIENQITGFGSIIPSDLNQNNLLEFVNGKTGSQFDTTLFTFDNNLQTLLGWPQIGGCNDKSTPVIGRFTYSNELNILANTWSAFNPIGYGCIYGYRYNGEQLPWSPLRPEGLVQAISSADINNDGSVELIALSSRTGNETYIHVWTFPNVPFSYEDFPWPQFGHDRYRTNQYGFLPPDEPIGIQPINNNVPSSFRLHQNYPNPFNPFTNIRFDVPRESTVRLVIYDVLGRELEVLVNENLRAGGYRVNWDATKYSSGIYFYRITSGSYSETRKMIVVK